MNLIDGNLIVFENHAQGQTFVVVKERNNFCQVWYGIKHISMMLVSWGFLFHFIVLYCIVLAAYMFGFLNLELYVKSQQW